MHFRHTFLKSVVAGAVAVALTSGIAMAVTRGTGTVTTDALRLRSQASVEAAVKGYIPRSTSATILGALSEEWYKATSNGMEAKAASYSVDAQSEDAEEGMKALTGLVKASQLYVRAGAGTEYDIVGTLLEGARVAILDQSVEGWYQVTDDTLTGYVSAEWVEVEQPQSEQSDEEEPSEESTQTEEPQAEPAEEAPAEETPAEEAPALQVSAVERVGTVSAGALNLRAATDASSEKVGSLKKGTVVTFHECNVDGWYQVTHNGVTGYVSAEWITLGGGNKDSKATVTATSLNIRSGPDASTDKVGSFREGAKITILDDSYKGWYQVSDGTTTGYVSAEWVTLGEVAVEPENPVVRTGTVSTASLNVRSGAGTGYSKVATLKKGTVISYSECGVSGWYKISCGSITGYVSASFVVDGEVTYPADTPAADTNTGSADTGADNSTPVETPPQQSAPSYSSVGAAAADLAWAQVGKPYIYGSAGPNGFDCSGLVYYVYRQLGYSVARGSSSQYYNSGSFVSTSDLQPGDLLFFFDPKYDSSGGTLPTTHVGIYVGNNQFVHASTPRSGVRVDTLFGGYHGTYLIAAKRIG